MFAASRRLCLRKNKYSSCVYNATQIKFSTYVYGWIQFKKIKEGWQPTVNRAKYFYIHPFYHITTTTTLRGRTTFHSKQKRMSSKKRVLYVCVQRGTKFSSVRIQLQKKQIKEEGRQTTVNKPPTFFFYVSLLPHHHHRRHQHHHHSANTPQSKFSQQREEDVFKKRVQVLNRF